MFGLNTGFLMADGRDIDASEDERFMQRAIALAQMSAGATSPNPMVGCVIVRNGEIVGEGWHAGPGKLHAEPAALAAAGDAARGATAYVTLEPCNHHGRTPPCSSALIDAGLREIVYAIDDPNPTARGGAVALRAAGVIVRSGVCHAQAYELNRAWFHSVEIGRPYVVAKAAMSVDGRVATSAGESKWITGECARRKGHELRWRSDAIIVGADTVIHDDPTLTARINEDVRHPLRIVLDSKGRTSPGAKVFERSGKGAVLATTPALSAARTNEYFEFGVDVMRISADDKGRVDLHDLLNTLHQRGVVSVMVEGGGRTLGAFLEHDLIDEAWLFLAPVMLGGGRAAFDGASPSRLADAARFDFDEPQMLGPDIFIRARRNREAV